MTVGATQMPARVSTGDRDAVLRHVYTQCDSDFTQSTATIRSPFCGYNVTECAEIIGEDLSCYFNKIQSRHPTRRVVSGNYVRQTAM